MARSVEERRKLPLTRWTDSTRRGSFAAFFARYGSLGRAEFVAAFRAPVLMTAVSVSSETWAGTLVLKVEKKLSPARIAIAPGSKSTGDLDSGSGRIHIGRTVENDVVIPAPTVSKRHAFLAHRDFGWEMSDAGSSNGTLLDGQKLRPNRRERIKRVMSTVQFGPDARFVFAQPDAIFDLFVEIHRSQGIRGHTTVMPAEPYVLVDPQDFESLSAPAPDDAPEIAEVPPVDPPKEAPAVPRPRSTSKESRSALAGESSGRSTDRIEVPVGKTPEEVDAIAFDYALEAVASLGALVRRLDATVADHRVRLLGEGCSNSVEECRAALTGLRTRIRVIDMELSIGDRKSIEIFRARS